MSRLLGRTVVPTRKQHEQSDFEHPGEFGLPDILHSMKSCPSLALPNFDVPFSFIYPEAKINEVLYIFDGSFGDLPLDLPDSEL